MDMRRVLSHPPTFRSAVASVRGTLREITRPVTDDERFYHRDLLRRDVDGRPAHDMPLTPPGAKCEVFAGDLGAAHYHFGRRSTDGAQLVAFAGRTCPSAIDAELATSGAQVAL